jgi:hypothetical protein
MDTMDDELKIQEVGTKEVGIIACFVYDNSQAPNLVTES